MRNRRRVVAFAVLLDAVAVLAAVWLFVATGNAIVLAFGVILALAPWAALIDDEERARRRR
ncbi:MAG: hypothetical protein ACJ77N_01780 [Chloroflexota bacterium]